MKYSFSRPQIKSIEDFLSREYLLTNGKGGYASSTLADCHTRKYHGLLAGPVDHLGKVYLFLSKIELSLISGTRQSDLSVNRFPNTYFPRGDELIQSVEIDYAPVTTYAVQEGAIILKKTLLMPRGDMAILVRYELINSSKPVTLKLAPLIAYREIHSVVRQNANFRPRTYFEQNGFKIDPYENLPPLFVQTSKLSTFYPAPDWWNNFEYTEERNRGYEFREDLFSPGIFEVKLKKGEQVIIRAALTPAKQDGIEKAWKTENERVLCLVKHHETEEEPLRTLKVQASHYITDEPQGLLAGYPWFCNDWGRDTFISIPGLLLRRGLDKETFQILKRYAALEKNGLLPNTVSSIGDHSYNSVDAPFLFFWTAQRFLEVTDDRSRAETALFPVMERILESFIGGRVPFATVGEDGFLYAGNEKTQLTWMDAMVNGNPVTPRHGAPVEVNALFYNALVFILESYPNRLRPDNLQKFKRIRRLFEKNFPLYFWNAEDSCLVDVYRSPSDRDTSIRPNQLFAVGLPAGCLETEKALAVLDAVKIHLVTPYGLRTLSPRHESFHPSYEGDQKKRDQAYHQGMVWPWLIGIYFDAMKKHGTDLRAVKTYFRNTFAPLWEQHLAEQCLFHISEIFTPLFPHSGKGCPAQAWSIAEFIRVLEACKE